MEDIIIKAIQSKKLVSFKYKGFDRIAEPHIFGIKSEMKQMLVFQVDGESSKGKGSLPDWRRVDLVDVQGLELLDKEFAGPRPYPSGKHSSWDRTIAIVQ